MIGLGGKENGVPRESGFDITVASEVMAILALCTRYSRSAGAHRALRRRPTLATAALVTLEDLRVAGAMTALLRDAIKPTLMQTLENTPALVHCGPFANIAHGNSSVLADLIGRKCADYLITESGFGADMGMEKFMDIKCRVSGMIPDVVVLVATVRALKMHSGHYRVIAGKPLDPRLDSEDLAALHEGMSNLIAQIENVGRFGVPCVVCINRFPTDTARRGRRDPTGQSCCRRGGCGACPPILWTAGPERWRYVKPLPPPPSCPTRSASSTTSIGRLNAKSKRLLPVYTAQPP